MNFENPAISLIVPVYNVEKYLAQCLDSILNQTFSDYELILINDGSTDNSAAICEKYRDKDHRIRIVTTANYGLSAARNEGLSIACGDVIGFIDSDDIVSPMYLDILYGILKKGNYDIAVADYRYISSEDSLPGCPSTKVEHQSLNRKELLNNFFQKGAFRTAWGKLYKKRIIGNKKFGDLKIAEDYEFNSAVFLKAGKIGYVHQSLYYYRIREGSLTYRQNLDTCLSIIDCDCDAINNLKGENPWDKLALIRLFKDILILRYECGNQIGGEIKAKIESLIGNKDFSSIKLSPLFKLAVKTGWHFPFLYKGYRKVSLSCAKILGKVT